MTSILKILFARLFFGVSSCFYLGAQANGSKYFKNYNVETDDLQPQNWTIIQDHRGIIYAANQGGLAQYDGVSWRNIKIPIYAVRSLAVEIIYLTPILCLPLC